ncbi:hypothetical protein Mgra_00004761 [Meloidogyne graminicola]|uniref:Uncharacterized protein n=1 Tax=Meloidogyne graminicola TaxID=189291 RepID=A0A8S9ZR00_9BILA|nr:hypothetical protein Mgra_00004761 [Meloidogyne graminicola]
MYCLLINLINIFNGIFEKRCKKIKDNDELINMKKSVHFEVLSNIIIELNKQKYLENYQKMLEFIKVLFEVNNVQGIELINKIIKNSQELEKIETHWELDNKNNEYNYLNPEGFKILKNKLFEEIHEKYNKILINSEEINKDFKFIIKLKESFEKVLDNWIIKNKINIKYLITGIFELNIWTAENNEINVIFLNEEYFESKYFGSDMSICQPLFSLNCKDDSLYCFLCKEEIPDLEINLNNLKKYTNKGNKYIELNSKFKQLKLYTNMKTFNALKQINEINDEIFRLAFILLNRWAECWIF